MRKFSILLVLAGAVGLWAQSYKQMATTKQLMAGLIGPAQGSLGALMKTGGPQEDKDWAATEQSAALLGEGAQLLTMGNRAPDHDAWVKDCEQLVTASEALSKAAASKDVDAWKSAMGEVGAACKECHATYRMRRNK
jgi:cytochrome c556